MDLFEFLADNQFGDKKVRPLGGHRQLPATTRLFPIMKTGHADSLKLNTFWQIQDRRANLTKSSFNYLTSSNGGLVNQGQWPLTQLLTFQGNIAAGEEINDDWVMIYTNILKSTTILPYTEQTWTNIDKNGKLTYGKNFLLRSNFYLVSKNGYLYVESFKVKRAGETYKIKGVGRAG